MNREAITGLGFVKAADDYVGSLKGEINALQIEQADCFAWMSDALPLLEWMARNGSIDARHMIDRYNDVIEWEEPRREGNR